MVLSYYYPAPARKMLLQARLEYCSSLVKLLCIYFCYFDLFNHGEPVLKNFFFCKNFVLLERSPLHAAIKRIKPLKK